jgi:methyl-accepting chemotaxis protein
VWNWAIWGTLIFGFVAIGWGTARLTRSLVALFRDIGRLKSAVLDALDELADAAERAADRADTLGPKTERLAASLDRLAASRRQLAVLEAGWSEVSEPVAAVMAFYPRK